jgi:hypothetical protein
VGAEGVPVDDGSSSPPPDVAVLYVPSIASNLHANKTEMLMHTGFLSTLHAEANAAGHACAILADAHLGHTPALSPCTHTGLARHD